MFGVDDQPRRFCRYELGGGPAQIVSDTRVNDNQVHTIKLTRKGRTGKMELDEKSSDSATSGGILAMLNAEGNIYIGKDLRNLSRGAP